MTRKDIQEDLVKLFLRLNGYFTTGLIIHSPTFGENQTELDIVAVRFPYHNQADRIITCSEFLQIPQGTIDIIIGEVKGGKRSIQFNPALREDKTSIEKLVKWVGAFDNEESIKVIDLLQKSMTPEQINTPSNFKKIFFQSKTCKYSIRPIVFSVDRPKPKRNQERFVYGQLMLDYIWNCFQPEAIRQSCSTVYDNNMWGHSLLPIIEYFKDGSKQTVGDISDYYQHFNC